MSNPAKHLPKITLEPVIFFFVFFNYLMNGAKQMANLKHDLVCQVNLNRSVTDCANRTFDTELQIQVQEIINHFEFKKRYLGMAPAFIYTLLAGALSDRYGRKPLLLFPLIGSLITKSVYVIGSLFPNQLPLDFFYLAAAWDIFGGMPIYYMGIYGYGSNAAKQPQRATTLARFDGIELLSIMLGTALSPYIFSRTHYLGSFVLGFFGNMVGIVALVWFTTEPLKTTMNDEANADSNISCGQTLVSLVRRFLFDPIKETLQCIAKKRAQGLRTLLIMVFFNYWMYLFILEGDNLKYLYMLRKFPGFDGNDHALYTVVMKLTGLFSLLVVVPIFSGRFQMHETIMLSFMSGLAALSRYWSAFAHNLWPEFYLASILNFTQISMYCTNRSLVTRCIKDDEIGKCFAAIAIFAALMPSISNPAFRLLYQSTLRTFPGAFLILGASALTLAFMVNLILVSQRRKMSTAEVSCAE